MKTIRQAFETLVSGDKQKRITKNISILILMISLFGYKEAAAQNTASATPINDLLMYWFFGGVAIVFFGLVVYVFGTAVSALHENGRTVELNFPIIRKMAQNEKTVGIIILLVVLTGIIWAIKFVG